MKRRYKILLSLVVVPLVLWFALSITAAYVFANVPRGREIEDRSEIAGTPVEAITLTTRDGVGISAWHVKNNPDRVVLFAHGIGSSRKQGLHAAEMYQDWGYSLIMLDARGHGKSDNRPCSIGWNERLDLVAAYDYAREQGYTSIAGHGISMGAATVSYSLAEDLDYDFIVLESCYDTIDNAARNRVAMVGAPYALTWPFRRATEWFTSVSSDQLRPLDYLPRAVAPTLILAGDSEPELKVSETQGLFDACAASVKQLHFFAGGRHQNFANHFEDEYREVVGAFIAARSAPLAVAHSAK